VNVWFRASGQEKGVAGPLNIPANALNRILAKRRQEKKGGISIPRYLSVKEKKGGNTVLGR